MKGRTLIPCFVTFCIVTIQPVLSQQSNGTSVNISTISIPNTLNRTEVFEPGEERRQGIMKIKTNTKPSMVNKIYLTMMSPIKSILEAPKVSAVMRNIGTCVVNGAVELISYYFPAPLIPIIASAAGMMIPFEPVLMLRDKMPVTSYRRAFMTALNSFLGKFDRYKLRDNNEYDPYMTERFNRRMMNYGGKSWTPLETTTPENEDPQSRKIYKGSFLAAIDKVFSTLDKLRREDGGEESEGDPERQYDWKNNRRKTRSAGN